MLSNSDEKKGMKSNRENTKIFLQFKPLRNNINSEKFRVQNHVCGKPRVSIILPVTSYQQQQTRNRGH